MASVIRIAAALIEGPQGRILLVRKRGSAIFMQAGGKIEPGETPLAALIRELEEELALRIAPEAAELLGAFEAPAANEPGCMVHATVFRLRLERAEVHPRAEIAEAVWLDPLAPPEGVRLASLLERAMLPLLRREREIAALHNSSAAADSGGSAPAD